MQSLNYVIEQDLSNLALCIFKVNLLKSEIFANYQLN